MQHFDEQNRAMPGQRASLSLTPEPAFIVDHVDDSTDTRLYRLQLQSADRARWHAARPGQFFMLSVPGFGEAAFTFVQLPDSQGCFSALVRRMGTLTSALFALPAGTVVGVRGPYGRPWPALLAEQSLLVIAGGCGLAPLAAVLARRCAQPTAAPTALLYGARDAAHAVLPAERAQWRAAGLMGMDVVDDIALHPDILQRQAHVRVDRVVCEMLALGHAPARVFLCGPEAMMSSVALHLLTLNLPASAIFLSLERRMHCAVGSCGHCHLGLGALGHHYLCRSGPTCSWEELAPAWTPSTATFGQSCQR